MKKIYMIYTMFCWLTDYDDLWLQHDLAFSSLQIKSHLHLITISYHIQIHFQWKVESSSYHVLSFIHLNHNTKKPIQSIVIRNNLSFMMSQLFYMICICVFGFHKFTRDYGLQFYFHFRNWTIHSTFFHVCEIIICYH